MPNIEVFGLGPSKSETKLIIPKQSTSLAPRSSFGKATFLFALFSQNKAKNMESISTAAIKNVNFGNSYELKIFGTKTRGRTRIKDRNVRLVISLIIRTISKIIFLEAQVLRLQVIPDLGLLYI